MVQVRYMIYYLGIFTENINSYFSVVLTKENFFELIYFYKITYFPGIFT